ncbi:MAG: hypothetical protein ACK4YF_01725 [Exilispira sp.]
MNLYDVKAKDIIEIVDIRLPARTIERFNSINFSCGKIFIVDQIFSKKEDVRFIKLYFYDSNSNINDYKKQDDVNEKRDNNFSINENNQNENNNENFLIISSYYFDKIIVKIPENYNNF